MGNSIFVSTSAGTYRSEDDGKSWIAIYDSLGKPVAGNLFNVDGSLFAVKYVENQVFEIGGLVNITPPRIYLLKSNERSWAPTQVPQGVRSVTAITAVGNTLFIGTDEGIYYRENDSESWKPTNTELRIGSSHNLVPLQDKRFVVVDEENPIYRGIGPSKVYRSDDNGETWQTASGGLGDDHIYALSVIDKTLFAGSSVGVYRSQDFGGSWHSMGPAYNAEGEALPFTVVRLVSNGDTLFAVVHSLHGPVKNGILR
ncbi:MAG: WD40/YVTN/BNR-like repeat-containing protein, partial [Pyrinomonadaceae bacterium]